MRRMLIFALLLGCEREEREIGTPAHALAEPPTVSTYPGRALPMAGMPIDPAMSGYEETAFAVARGRQLYRAFNCVGCHAAGGGAIGPPFIDERWDYGSSPYDVATSIVAGRPRGMPSFRGKLVPQQLFQLVAYVRSLGGFVRGDAVSPRGDHSQKLKSPNLTDEGWPK